MSKASPSRPRPEPPEPALLLPEGGAFDGLATFRGAARLEGELTGRVVARGRLEVGPRARVTARVDVDELVVEGLVEGELRARVRAEIRASARVRGRLVAPRLAVDEGAVLEARCCMGDAPAPAGGDPGGEHAAPQRPPGAPGAAPPAAASP